MKHSVKTIAIIPAHSPLDCKMAEDPADHSYERLVYELAIGHFMFFKTQGTSFTNFESVVIFNIHIDHVKTISQRYHLRSAVIIDCRTRGEINCQYWESEDCNKPLELRKEEHCPVDDSTEEKFYTQIGNKFNFNIPLFEEYMKYNAFIEANCNPVYYSEMLIEESLDPKYTGKHQYICRCKLLGKTLYAIARHVGFSFAKKKSLNSLSVSLIRCNFGE